MTALERIWASADLRREDQGSWWNSNPGGDAVEYVRADLAPALEVPEVAALVFNWTLDATSQNPSCWRCEGNGFFAYVLIPYDPGNDPAAGIGKWNANPNHRGKIGFASRQEAMTYCEESIRTQAAEKLRFALAVPEVAALVEAAKEMDAAFYSEGNVTERHSKACKAGVKLDAALRAIAALRGEASHDPQAD